MFIMDDLKYKDRGFHRKLRQIASQEREKDVKVKVYYQSFTINEQKLKWSHTTYELEKEQEGGR